MEWRESDAKSVALSREVVRFEGPVEVVAEDMAWALTSEGALVVTTAGDVEANRTAAPFRTKLLVFPSPSLPYPPAAIMRFLERGPLALMELCNTGEEENFRC